MQIQHLAGQSRPECCVAAFASQRSVDKSKSYHFPPVYDTLAIGATQAASPLYRENLTMVGLFSVGRVNRRLRCPRASNFHSLSVLLPWQQPAPSSPSPNMSKLRPRRFRMSRSTPASTSKYDPRGRAMRPAPTPSPAPDRASSNQWGSPC